MIWGLLAFVLYFVYDLNDLFFHNKILHKSFLVGSLVLIVSTARIILMSDPFQCEWFWLLAAIFFCGLLVYTLFFALPFEETYIKNSNQRKVYSKGMYGICRHPGFWWFLFMYFCLGLAFPHSQMMPFGLLCSFLNGLYIWFQDVYVFERLFVDYGEYKHKVAFLIPRRRKNAISR